MRFGWVERGSLTESAAQRAAASVGEVNGERGRGIAGERFLGEVGLGCTDDLPVGGDRHGREWSDEKDERENESNKLLAGAFHDRLIIDDWARPASEELASAAP